MNRRPVLEADPIVGNVGCVGAYRPGFTIGRRYRVKAGVRTTGRYGRDCP